MVGNYGGEQEWGYWEEQFTRFLAQGSGQDPAHDRGHVLRVVANAHALAAEEGARLEVVLPAAWLHDCVSVAKDSAQRPEASRMAAEEATRFLRRSGYPKRDITAIAHAIHAHSFSAQIAPETLEAQVVQDADRLDAIGAIGIARCFAVGGALGLTLYDLDEPFPESRLVDEKKYSVDHFYAKLFHLAGHMNTRAGRIEAERRTRFMRQYLSQLADEIKGFL
jgi:uncharacterized protein